MIWKAIQRWSSLDILRHHYILDFSRDCSRLMTLDWTCVLNMNVFLALNVFYMPDIIDMESVTQKISWIFGRLGHCKKQMVCQKIQTGKGKMGAWGAFFFFFLLFYLKKSYKKVKYRNIPLFTNDSYGQWFWLDFFFLTSACKAL